MLRDTVRRTDECTSLFARSLLGVADERRYDHRYLPPRHDRDFLYCTSYRRPRRSGAMGPASSERLPVLVDFCSFASAGVCECWVPGTILRIGAPFLAPVLATCLQALPMRINLQEPTIITGCPKVDHCPPASCFARWFTSLESLGVCSLLHRPRYEVVGTQVSAIHHGEIPSKYDARMYKYCTVRSTSYCMQNTEAS